MAYACLRYGWLHGNLVSRYLTISTIRRCTQQCTRDKAKRYTRNRQWNTSRISLTRAPSYLCTKDFASVSRVISFSRPSLIHRRDATDATVAKPLSKYIYSVQRSHVCTYMHDSQSIYTRVFTLVVLLRALCVHRCVCCVCHADVRTYTCIWLHVRTYVDRCATQDTRIDHWPISENDCAARYTHRFANLLKRNNIISQTPLLSLPYSFSFRSSFSRITCTYERHSFTDVIFSNHCWIRISREQSWKCNLNFLEK